MFLVVYGSFAPFRPIVTVTKERVWGRGGFTTKEITLDDGKMVRRKN